MEGGMRLLLILSALPILLHAQPDPAADAYSAWGLEHRASDHKARAQSLFEVSAEWTVKWPESRTAWDARRDSLLGTQNRSPELWKQVDETLVRLSPPHTFADLAAYDWVTLHINLKDAEKLIASEIEWHEAQPRPNRPSAPSLADLIDEANASSILFGPLCTLASAQIQLQEFDPALATIGRIRTWLDGDFKRNYDQDPLEAFPDFESHYFILSAQLAQAEGRNIDALAFFQHVIANPYYRREYAGYEKETRSLWNKTGGTDAGWAIFSRVPPLPAGVPAGHAGTSFLPWIALDYKLPEMNVPSLDSRTWTRGDFEGKSTIVYLWASWCGPCWLHLPAIQALYDTIKDRRDIQIVALSMDDDRQKLSAFMKEKGYTFPVLIGKSYVDKLLPHPRLGQDWIVDKTGTIRLQRATFIIRGREQAFVDEAVYKLTQVSKDGLR
jgi:peroxiredoxin